MSLPIETDCQTVKSLRDDGADFLLLDCREQDEYDLVHIAGAQFIPMSQIQTRLEELRPHQQRRIVIHCHHGGRSLRVAAWLRQQGICKFPKPLGRDRPVGRGNRALTAAILAAILTDFDWRNPAQKRIINRVPRAGFCTLVF